MKHVVLSDPLGGLTSAFKNLLILKSKDKLSYGNLTSEKVRGVVCSENMGTPPIDSGNSIEAQCSASLNQVKNDNKPG